MARASCRARSGLSISAMTQSYAWRRRASTCRRAAALIALEEGARHLRHVEVEKARVLHEESTQVDERRHGVPALLLDRLEMTDADLGALRNLKQVDAARLAHAPEQVAGKLGLDPERRLR